MGRSQRHLREIQIKDSSGAARPIVNAKPTVAGTATNGQTLTGTNATFTNGTPTSVARQWYRDGVAISGATAATRVLAGADVGHKITFGNAATNNYGTTQTLSNPTATVA